MKVNIVMLVKDRQTLTVQALDTLFRTTPIDLFNLTVIDDESDWPVHYVTGMSNACCLRIHRSKGITGQARNLGIYFAERYWGRGDYLYLSDNDMYFTPHWLERLIEAFEISQRRRNVALIGGWNHPFLQPKDQPANYSNVYLHDVVTGASQLMRWETWDKYGPLDAHAKGVGQSEDWAFCQKIINNGGHVASVYPRVIANVGLTNSFGKSSPGADEMVKELIEAKKFFPDLHWE